MGRVYKKRTKVKDPVTGETTYVESRKYHVEYLDEHRKKRRKAVSPDKSVATQKLAQLEREVDRKRNGVFDPYEAQRLRPIAEHLKDFEQFMRSKGNTEHHTNQVVKRATDVMTECGFIRITDLRSAALQNNLHDRRNAGRSAQTCNFYLKAATQFVRWLVQDQRLPTNPLRGLKLLNVKADRRHDRRALSADEFDRLLLAAQQGKRVECIPGAERRIIYLVASATGLRRAELASLTLRSLNLDDEYPSVTVLACYSKNGRDDILPLHPAVVEELRVWLAKQKLTPSQSLFHLKSATGKLRDTANMMNRDLAAAKKKWIGESNDPDEQKRRRESDFLCYKNSAGLFADFHANRHTFISNLARADVHPKMAQTLARHSTINLTMNTYTHVNLEEKSRAVGRLQPPGSAVPSKPAIGQIDGPLGAAEVSVLGSKGVPNGVTIEAARGSEEAPSGTNDGLQSAQDGHQSQGQNMKEDNDLGVSRPSLAPPGMIAERPQKELHLSGLEPETFGSVDRCSIQLS